MKSILTTLLVLIVIGYSYAQQEAEILALSKEKFNWEVENTIDALANLIDEKFIVVNSKGEIQTKSQYLAIFRSGNFIHNSIEIEESTAAVINNTATVAGKGKFTITVSGNKTTRHLCYTEVYIRYQKEWKLLSLHASLLED